MLRDNASEREIAAILRGETCRPANPREFADMAIRHRVAPLLVGAGASKRLPAPEAARLLADASAAAARSELRDRELRRVLPALDACGIEALVMKGAHLAHSHYASPHLRPSDDVDVLVRRGDLERATVVFANAGYRREDVVTGDVVLGQALFARDGGGGTPFDVHWRIAAPRLAADLLRFDELASRAVPLTALGPGARGLSAVDALALACVHQAAHHPGHELMLWTYDAHVLTSTMTERQADEFAALAIDRRMAALCVHALRKAARAFPNAIVHRILERLECAPRDEPTAVLIDPRRPMDELLLDLSVLRDWRERLQLVLGHLFPPPAYMRKAFAASGPAMLPWLYVYRIVRGAGRWMRVK